MSRVRTLNFLPEIFQTPSNAEFLAATLDQIVNPPSTMRIQGFVGSRFGYGVNALDYYVVEPTKTRTDYQLDPAVVFTKPNQSVAQDFISYPGIIDSLKMQYGVTDNNNRLFKSQFYSWDSFTNLDKLINFNEYYWLPVGPPAVTVAAAQIFASEDYVVTDTPAGYNIAPAGQSVGSINPTLTLLRGGTYYFEVNQTSQFWIQSLPGTSGYSPTQPSISTRQVYGVSNNGASQGIVTFTVPSKDAQNQYVFPGNNTVDIVSTKSFEQINGQLLNTYTDPATGVVYPGVNNIDGITALQGLRVMFYNDGVPNETGFTSSYFGETNYDVNSDVIVAPLTLTVESCDTNAFTLASGSTDSLTVNNTITFNSSEFSGVISGQVYYISSIVNSTDFTISETLDGVNVVLTPGSGAIQVNINQGLYEEGFYSFVSQNYYVIEYVGDPSNPTLRLTPAGTIPTNERITPIYGVQWNSVPFYRNTAGVISPIPAITAPLDTLYYQDGTSANKVGILNIVDNNLTNTINVNSDILGKKNYTSPNGVVFTNGLKVLFDGAVYPSSYLSGEYYVEGVGTAIELVPTTDLVCPEGFTYGTSIPYDSTKYDTGNYDADLFIPIDQDYITIARNSISRNAWSRSNRWFHIDVINATATYNNNSSIVTEYALQKFKAVRPIIEFYPNLKLYNSGSIGTAPVDFIDTHNTDALSTVAGAQNYYPDTEVYTSAAATIAAVTGTTTTVTILASAVTGTFQVGMYITDSTNVLPTNTQINSITGTGTLTLSVSWENSTTIPATTDASLVGSDSTLDNYNLFPEARVIFAADADATVRNKIYIVNFSQITPSSVPVITLTEAPDGQVAVNEQVAIKRGYHYQGYSFYYDGIEWIEAQQKVTVNQPPLFDVFDTNGISFSDPEVYQSTSFAGCKLFAYGLGISSIDDPILGFPVRYSSIDNVGDISFDVSLNLDTFNYVTGLDSITQKVNTGYVYDYTSRTTYVRQIGWNTAIADSVQYQIFEFDFDPLSPVNPYVCDIAALPELATDEKGWPRIQVFINNVYQEPSTYSYVVGTDTTTITLDTLPTVNTVVQFLILSDQVSPTAYYQVPVNLSNNPLNQDLTTANVGDIRSQYQDIFINAPNTTGNIFGANNFRDCGNLIPYGTKIIQNSASLVLPGAFFRKKTHNLFDALMFNSREYIKYKQLLVDTVQTTDYSQRYTPAQMLDMALDQITAAKSEINAFFWSDMLPSKAPYLSNNYTFNNNLDNSIYPLSHVYNFGSANYDGVLVYLTTTVDNSVVQRQLINGIDYTVSTDSPSLTVTTDLVAGDVITVNQFNQTYGSYIPNTPTKLGLYPSFIPAVVLDVDYLVPTYFIKGHDGSFTKLYGTYDSVTGQLEDIRDQVLLEFEQRIYNNLKLSTTVPISRYEVMPGYFRDPTYSWTEFVEMYSPTFLTWVGQNRLDYKTQYYNRNDEFSYNYTNSGNKLDNASITQGYWRGVYEYFYDTVSPNETPWEMLNFSIMPSWWTTRYGPAPYTSDNGVLWGDLEAGLIWNNGDPYIVPELARPGLSKIIPVDSSGQLLSPLVVLVGNYNPGTFQKDWVVGDDAPVELSYRRSSTWPFDLMRLFALTRPAEFFNLGVDLDNYNYNAEFNQYLVNDRSHLVVSDIQIYGNGIAKTSYINWIVDFEKQLGIDATTNITTLLDNLDVRLVYRLAGYSDKTLLNFYVEKGSPSSKNASLLIPDESYSILLYDNQPFDQLAYSGVVLQKNAGYWTVYGNSQTFAYFSIKKPINNGKYLSINVLGTTVKYAADYSDTTVLIPYGTTFYSIQEVVQFLMSYSAYLQDNGMIFSEVEQGVEVTWSQMASEFVYWTLTGWETGSIITLNPAATVMNIDKPSSIVQPLTVQQTNFILNQNLYPIQLTDLCVERSDTLFHVHTLNQGDSMSYAQFNLSNFEHGIVFDNITLFNDVIYNLTTGLRQNRIYTRGVKTAEWNGTVNAYGFIINQDNIVEWSPNLKYTKGVIVKYKNKYWAALKIVEPTAKFNELDWKIVDYENIQKGMLPNSSTRAYESTLYYDINQANLEQDADLLSFSLIGYRPRDYLALVDLTDTTQINVYKNLIRNKGTRNAIDAFQGANLPQGGIKYDFYENWAIKQGEYGGVLNENFVEFNLRQAVLTGNPSIVSLTQGIPTVGSMQEVPLYSLFNYSTPITSPNVLSTLNTTITSQLYPSAGYVNFNDVKMSSYFFAGLPAAVDATGVVVPIQNFYLGEYFWLANFKNKWNVFKWTTIGQVIQVRNNANGTSTITFNDHHSLQRLEPIAIINFSQNVDGYYIVTEVLNTTEVMINLVAQNIAAAATVQGRGLAFSFESHRVTSPAEIGTLALLDNEFVKNTVWVDENTDGNWAVYRKSINYLYEHKLESSDASTFGTAVAHTTQAGYLVSDPTYSEDGITVTGQVYRYNYNILHSDYVLVETLTEGASFGSVIEYAQNVYVVSEPTSVSPKVYIYVINDTIVTDAMLQTQTISAPGGVTDWGSAVAISDDMNWLYVSAYLNDTVYVYRRQNIPTSSGYFVPGETYIITDIADTDFTDVGAVDNKIGIVFVATGAGTGSGTATLSSYALSNTIVGTSYGCTAGDQFGKAIATDENGDTVVISAPGTDYSVSIQNWGQVYILQRTVQNFEAQFNSVPDQPVVFSLAWSPNTVSRSSTEVIADSKIEFTTGIHLNNYIGYPVVFTGTDFGDSRISPYQVYYIYDASSTSTKWIQIAGSRDAAAPITLDVDSGLSFSFYVQTDPLYVSRNGTLVTDDSYAVIGTNFVYYSTLLAGDIINVGGNQFFLGQTVNSDYTDRTDIQFGYDVDTNRHGSLILVGSPYEIDGDNREGAVYSYINSGARYGIVVGTSECNVTTNRTVFINGFAVALSAGNAEHVAGIINNTSITNVKAGFTSSNKLIIQVINTELAQINEKLFVDAYDSSTLNELGITLYTNTQIIHCPHAVGATRFGNTIKINEFESVAISAPVGTRYEGTVFDFTDDENLDNDTVFDNNATRFVDAYPNAGAVYMFDYLSVYDESIDNPGAFVYAQSVNSTSLPYGQQPLYGTAIDFSEYTVIVGSPNFYPVSVGGQAVVYVNAFGVPDWSVYRQSAPIVDINKIQNTQIFSATTNNTLINLDYMDPLQGKLLGAARENIDFVSGTDPARYNSDRATVVGSIWGAEHAGKLWFNTNNVRWVNYHQNDVVYNSRYWGRVFPGSDVAVYTWVASFVAPNAYPGPGTVYDVNLYTVSTALNASNVAVPVYYFWVRNTNVISEQRQKTLSDSVVASYIANPLNSGIAYMSPLLPNTFALYNSVAYFNGNDSVFHVGYANGTTDDVAHQEFALIRENYPDDYLPGVPNKNDSNQEPYGLYARFLDSMSGTNLAGGVVPNPYLPKAVQSGVLARPRQSFFLDRLGALQNYFQKTNRLLLAYPFFEFFISRLLTQQGEFFDVTQYWELVDWWAPGYNSSTKSNYQVPLYSDLARLSVTNGTIVTVQLNADGFSETYIFEANNWTRIGLQNGTIQFKSSLWDYANNQIGFGNQFFDTQPFDAYPSVETRYIVRAMTEEIPSEFYLERNQALILMFNYIQSESLDNQNYLPWLNKTSLADVSHTIRELKPYEVFQTDNQAFLAGYINETKPYHVVIKDFLFKYTGTDVFEGDITDFDLPATYNTDYQQYISPQLVYSIPDNQYEYDMDSTIWATAPYSQWFNNYGVSLTGQQNFNITVLRSYIDRGSSYILVDSSAGFPINGVIRIGSELIAYGSVDQEYKLLTGLIRGVDNTPITNHIPGASIYIDLPAVLLLNGGKGYSEPPRVTAYIDLAKYPAPTTPAVLEAVMSLDSVLQINVIDAGAGYAVLPEIRIDPSVTFYFANTAINSTLHTIKLYAPSLQTGDLLRYEQGLSASVGMLKDNQWYYVGVLEATPVAIVAFYTTYSDAINDTHRLLIYPIGTGNDMALNLGARASSISTAIPIRENTIRVKFDRTTYGSQVQDWAAGLFYGSFFAGSIDNSNTAASSSVQLESIAPPISSILASSQGVTFEIADVANDQVLEWSSFIRYVGSTQASDDSITLIPQDGNNDPLNPLGNASGTTIGFYVGMPIKFTGSIINNPNIQADTTYYVREIISDLDFTVQDSTGSIITLNDVTLGVYVMKCLVGEVTNTAVLTINYPGIRQVTATQSTSNKLTVPTSLIGTGGTAGFYVNLPIFFTDMTLDTSIGPKNVNDFGGIVQNQVYYVTTVIDSETFTMSKTTDPVLTTVYSTNGSTERITVESTNGFSVSDIVIFTAMTVAGSSVTTFGNIVAGTIYYITGVYTSTNEITISETRNGGNLNLSTVAAASDTNATVTDQKDTAALTDATGSATMNVSLPVSPGQVNGQLFTLYDTSVQYPGVVVDSTEVSNLLTRTVNAAITSVNRLALQDSEGGTTNFYENMPVRLASPGIGGLSAATTYYIKTYTGQEDPLNPGTYFTNINVNVVSTTSSGNWLVCDTALDSVDTLYIDMPIVFSGQSLGGILIGTTYFVSTIDTLNNRFKVSEEAGGTVSTLFNSNGEMTGTGDPYLTLSSSPSGAEVSLTTDTVAVEMSQYVTAYPTFDVSYIMGGYQAIPTDSGSGFVITNVITIPGTTVGGTSPENDIILTVNTIDATGGITDVIVSGAVPVAPKSYYLKVTSANQLEVYSNPLLTVPVSGLDFPFVGFTSASVTGINSGTDALTIGDTSVFFANDEVVFTGDTSVGVTNIVAGNKYYIYQILTGSTFTISTTPGDVTTVVNMVTTTSVDFTMAKAGSYAVLPEPFYFNQSIVKFNNAVYICVVSNNDPEFVFGKWELLDSGDNRLNAMDRVIGYYQPTVNMPGVDLTQLFEGVTYPNAIYQGNKFQPSQQFALDIVLQDQAFTITDVNLTSLAWTGAPYSTYIACANLPTYSALLYTTTGNDWYIVKLANGVVNPTDLLFAGEYGVITTTNNVTPIFRSLDGVNWSAAITVTPNDPSLTLNSVANGDGVWVAVGSSIVVSTDTYHWSVVYTFNPTYEVTMHSVSYVTTTGFTGFVAVGTGLKPDYSTGVTQLVSATVIVSSINGYNWTEVSPNGDKAMYCIASDGNVAIAAGEDEVKYSSIDGVNWLALSETKVSSFSTTNYLIAIDPSDLQTGFQVYFNTTFSTVVANTIYYVDSIVSPTLITISDTYGGGTKVLSADTLPPGTRMFVGNPSSPTTNAFRDMVYVDSLWVAVGDNGTVKTATSYYEWTARTSGTTENLLGIALGDSPVALVAVGEGSTVITSYQGATFGEIWVNTNTIDVVPPVYDVQGAPFEFGYGPEELVPGVVTDNLAMTVITRPGTTWPVVEFSHTGFSVTSLELTPTSGTQTEYSFAGIVQNPAQINLQVISSTTGLGVGITQDVDYTINWLTKIVTLTSPLAYGPSDTLRIDVYVPGNGDQLVKSSTDSNPIQIDDPSGFNTIFVDCNYTAPIYLGTGVIKYGSSDIEVKVFSSDSISDRYTCESVAKFTLNSPVTFQGILFGGVQDDVTYFIKSISTATNSFTLSASLNPLTGVAGPVFELTDDVGLMYVNLQVGNGQVWSDPIMYLDGTKLVLGTTNIVSRTKAGINTITTNSTAGLVPDTRITFSNTIFGDVIQPMTSYYISTVVDNNEFTISETMGGSILALTDATGGSSFITNDYAFGIQPNGISAKILFSTDQYTNDANYIVYTLFGETTPIQYGYTIPEVQYFNGNGATALFTLDNFAGDANAHNAIVEVNGIRQTAADYVIDSYYNTILFTVPPSLNSVISVMSYNDTNQQYMTTQYGITGQTVAAISNISNVISAPIATTYATATASTGNLITADDVTGFVINQPVQFFGASAMGNVEVDGTVYFIASVNTGTNEFTIKDQYGVTITLSDDIGNLLVQVGGSPSIRVTTTIDHNFVENSIVRIDGTSGSIQLNNNTYYAKIIDDKTFDLYETGIAGYSGYDPTVGALNYPVTTSASWTGGGYTWRAGLFYINTTSATATTHGPTVTAGSFIVGVPYTITTLGNTNFILIGAESNTVGLSFVATDIGTTVGTPGTATPNYITVNSTDDLVVGTPIYFSQTETLAGDVLVGGLVSGTEYYVRNIFSATKFNISTTRYGDEFTLTTDSGTINSTQWSQVNVDRIWVTVNGYRVPSSNLRLNDANEVSILTVIQSGDEIIITGMINYATPEEEIYMNFVDAAGAPAVYRANSLTRTWLTAPVFDLSSAIYVHDVTSITNQLTQNSTAPIIDSDGFYYVGINGDKQSITSVIIVNDTLVETIDPANYQIILVDTAPTLQIAAGDWINTGDSLTITVFEGNMIFLNGEQIKFTQVDFVNNLITGLERGVNGTAMQPYIPEFTAVFSMLKDNLLPETYYNQTWNSAVFDPVAGDPLQVSQTPQAEFLITNLT
jgi:hypothetical protein